MTTIKHNDKIYSVNNWNEAIALEIKLIKEILIYYDGEYANYIDYLEVITEVQTLFLEDKQPDEVLIIIDEFSYYFEEDEDEDNEIFLNLKSSLQLNDYARFISDWDES